MEEQLDKREQLDIEALDLLLAASMKEDLGGAGDITSLGIFGRRGGLKRGKIVVKGARYIATGLWVVGEVYKRLGGGVVVKDEVLDGREVKEGEILCILEGDIVSILEGERLVLNIVSHLMGISTKTKEYVDKVDGTKVKILDTRKTLPGLRSLCKAAVFHGGGENHRQGLYDAVLIKDNHIDAVGGVGKAIELFRASNLGANKFIEVEVRSKAEALAGINFGVNRLLLDNMSLEEIEEVVKLRKGVDIELEASGNISLMNVEEIAKTGVDYISIGSLTMSVMAADLSLQIL